MDKIKVFDGCFNPIKYIKNDDIFIVLTPEEKNELMVTREKFNEVVPDTANENNKLTDKEYVDGIKTASSTAINNEITRAKNAEQLLNTDIATINSKIPSAASNTNKLTDKLYVDELVNDEQSRAENVEDLLDRRIDHEIERASTKEMLLDSAITIINSKIPSTATDTNKLVDKDFIDSIIDDINNSINIIDEVTAESLYNLNERKQDIIEDLETIRSGAALGETAYQKPSTGIPPSDIANGVIPDVSQFITKSVNDLVNYYKKSETYTQSEVNALIGSIQQFHYEIYASLQDITTPATNVLYLIGPTGSGSDKYEEYVYANNSFTKIGDTTIDLSGYVTTQALSTALADYVTSTDLTTLLSGKQDKIDATHKLDADLVDDSTTTHKFVTTNEKETWNNKADIVDGKVQSTNGIEINSHESIATAVTVPFSDDYGQTFYKRAILKRFTDNEVVVGDQYAPDVRFEYDDKAVSLIDLVASAVLANSAYQKSSSGIPASDIAEGVIPDVSNFITASVDNLTNYYLKSETYTKSEVQGLIGAIQQFHYEIYPALPQNGESNVLYLIGPTGSGNDQYEEYVYANNDFTKIGDTSIDLSDYVTIQALNTALANYVTSSAFATALATKQDTLVSGTNIKTLNGDSILGSGNVNFAKYEDTLIDTTSVTCDELETIGGVSLYINTGAFTIKPNQKIVFNDTVGTNTLYLIDTTDVNNRTIVASGKSSISWNNFGNTDAQILVGSSSDYYQTLTANTYWRGTDNVFIAEYGVTTYQQVLDAYNAGKVVVCNKNGILGFATSKYSNYMNFTALDYNNLVMYAVYSDSSLYTNGWVTNINTRIEATSNKITSISSSSTNAQYPSAKAVYDYVQPQITTITFRTH